MIDRMPVIVNKAVMSPTASVDLQLNEILRYIRAIFSPFAKNVSGAVPLQNCQST